MFELIEVRECSLLVADRLDEDRGLGKRISLDGELLKLLGNLSFLGLSTGTDLVVPFLEAAILFHALSVMLRGKRTAVTNLILSEVALEFLALTVGLAGLTLGEYHSGTDILLLELLGLGDGVVVTTSSWAELGVALHFVAEGGFGRVLDGSLLVESIEVHSSEVHVLALVHLELPLGSSVTTSFGTVDFEDVLAGVQGGSEVELGGSSGLPDVLALLLHDLTIEDAHTAETEVSWDLEVVLSTVLTDWEVDLVVVANISVGTAAKLLVTD
jgi:hypothetical protein